MLSGRQTIHILHKMFMTLADISCR